MENKLPKDFIPSFDELYNATCEFVKQHQGENGYIDTQLKGCDVIYCFVCDDMSERGIEFKIHGVRVIDNDRLQIVYEPMTDTCEIRYTDEDFKDADWEDVGLKYLYNVYYVQTLYNIAEVIHEYVEK